MTMNEEHRGPRALVARCGPQDLDLFAGIPAVREEGSLNHPAAAIGYGTRLDRNTAKEHQQGRKEYAYGHRVHIHRPPRQRSTTSHGARDGHYAISPAPTTVRNQCARTAAQRRQPGPTKAAQRSRRGPVVLG